MPAGRGAGVHPLAVIALVMAIATWVGGAILTAQARSFDGLLVMFVYVPIGGLVSFVVALVAMRRAPRTPGSGRGLAIAAMAIAAPLLPLLLVTWSMLAMPGT